MPIHLHITILFILQCILISLFFLQKKYLDDPFAVAGFCAAEVSQQGHLLRDSLQCLDKTLDASDKSNACLWECERKAIQPIMQSWAASLPK